MNQDVVIQWGLKGPFWQEHSNPADPYYVSICEVDDHRVASTLLVNDEFADEGAARDRAALLAHLIGCRQRRNDGPSEINEAAIELLKLAEPAETLTPAPAWTPEPKTEASDAA